MTHVESDGLDASLALARRNARRGLYVQHARSMLMAAGIAAAGIVAVAAAMMATVF